MVKKILVVLILILGIHSIGIALRTKQSKCMIVYTVGQSDSVKMTTRFPEIPNKVDDQYYQIVIQNTETQQQVIERSLPGVYKRQLSLSPNVIYQICFRVKSDRDFGRIMIQYTAQNLFNLDHVDIKVPDNLLKTGDFKVAYQDAQKLHGVTQRFIQLQKERKQSQSQTFVRTTQINTNLLYISIAQVCIILVAGIYQFYTLRKYLVGKQYI